MSKFVGALDQGTTSTRFMVFDAGGREIARHQLEHEQIMTQPGWVEHDPLEIAERTNTVVAGALRHGGLSATDLAAIGITNQRETTVVWNPKTGQPWYNAIVWQDTRTDHIVSALDRGPRPIFLVPSCSGSWRTWTASAPRPPAAKRCSARSTAGRSGT